MKNIAFIPARSGSKSIINKNIQLVGQQSLLERTINSAKESGIFDIIHVSTDSGSYAQIAIDLGVSVPSLRPSHLAKDTSSTLDVILAYLAKEKSSTDNDRFFLLQPTSPFRNAKHIEQSHMLFETNKSCLSLASVVDVGGMHPYRMQIIDDNIGRNFMEIEKQDFSPRQSLPKVYIRNGAIYINTIGDIKSGRRILRERYMAFEMNDIDSLNIDSEKDLILAQEIVRRGMRK